MANEAQRMAEKYQALAETDNPADRQRYAGMVDWWLERAAETNAAEEAETPALSNPDTQAQNPPAPHAPNSNSADASSTVAESINEATQQPASDLASNPPSGAEPVEG